MRVMIVGAGIAGLTLAALLHRQGNDVAVVEKRAAVPRRAASDAGDGYALALWPHGTRVLHAVGVYQDMVAAAMPMHTYTARNHEGTVLSRSGIPAEVSEYGHVGLLARGDLMGLLSDVAAAGADLRYGRTVTDVSPGASGVDVRLDDGSQERVDVLIGADGIGSSLRPCVTDQTRRFDTGWACLVWWAAAELAEVGEVTERWGVGSFVGTYPCRDRLCVIVGAPSERFAVEADRPAAAVQLMREHGLADARWMPSSAGAVTVWPMSDVRASRWAAGRLALVGDAAVGFLPTAGVGASMALESAAALADELSRADAASAPKALELYERRRRRRTERAQSLSRRLARFTFVRSRGPAALRNLAFAHTNVETLVSPLLRELRRPL